MGRVAFLVALLVASFGIATAEPVPPALLDGLQWRLIGPFRGGWATVAAGVPDAPDTFYFGAAGGGVWKTTDAGETWAPIFDGQPVATIGALAVAPTDPRVIYVGTGQPEPRYDIAAGSGVYKSTDGGATWVHCGLAQTRHIGDLLVDPRDANVVLVAALGHLFGPNPERGVFRSTDGGGTWTRTLFVDDQTGAVDLAADPADADVIYAALWHARNWPWLSYFTPMVGVGSAIYRSGDGGKTWSRVGGAGWPAGKLGRIGLAIARRPGGTRIYASVDAERGQDPQDGASLSGLYRSDDGGASWEKVSAASSVTSWYMSRLTVAPNDPDTVFITGQSIQRSTDGGKTFTIFRGAPGGDDYHSLWIHPQHPERMITASDQGAIVTVNGGATWSSWYNQPTGQFYHLATDDRFPYWIYSSQQDSGTVAVASRSDYGALSYRDWHPIGGDERDHAIPDPIDPDIVYSTGLGGRLSRWNGRTGEVQNITPTPVNTYGRRPTDTRYRYTWITPLALSRRPPHALFQGAQVLFRSLDSGRSWEVISPDLSARKPDATACAGDLAPEEARDCGFGVIFTIAPSPLRNDEIWVGTDDGLVQLTRDGGKSWKNVTPAELPPWAKVSAIEPSALAAGTAYAAVDNHRQDDFAPHLWRTHDYGATWTSITGGLPADHFVSVVRADPERDGLLYAGTDTGVFVSFDDGAQWQPLQLNLPAAWVTDLDVHGDDLIVATQGRAIWVLDDVSPLRSATATLAGEPAHLFPPAPAVRLRANQNKDTPLQPEAPLGRNPPTGAVIDYWLAAAVHGPLVLEIRDSAGKLVRRFGSADEVEKLPVERYFTEDWLRPAAGLSSAAGAHRFVWDLRAARPRAVKYEYGIGASRAEGTPVLPAGPLVAPGEYRVALLVEGRTLTAPLVLLPDPRVQEQRGELEQAFEFVGAIGAALERVWLGHGEVRAVREQLVALKEKPGADGARRSVRAAIVALSAKTAPLVAGAGESSPNLGAISEELTGLATDVEGTDRAPTAAQRQLFAECEARVTQALELWQGIRQRDLPALNRRLGRARLPAVVVPPPDRIGSAGEVESKDLP